MSTVLSLARKNGWTVHDAKRHLEIEVAPSDIQDGQKSSHGECAFAVACKRKYKVDDAYFFRSAAWLRVGDKLYRYNMPASMRHEVVAFDRAKAMAPGTYRLAPPNPSRRLGYKDRGWGKKKKGNGVTMKDARHLTSGVRGQRL